MIQHYYQYSNNKYFEMQHDTISLISNNGIKVQQFENELKYISLQDIKSNKVKDRYPLLLALSFCGDNKLVYELIKLRFERDELSKKLLEDNYKKIYWDVLKEGKCKTEATKIIEELSGWVL